MLRCLLLSASLFCLLNSQLLWAQQAFMFREVGQENGLREALKNMHGHAAAWGDVNGDGSPDLYVGSFHKPGTRPNQLLIQKDGKFAPSDQAALNISARSSGAVCVDLDNDGDNDLYVSNLGGGQEGHSATDSKLFRNDGEGKFTDVSARSGACITPFRGRSVAALDFDGDGLLDLLVGESLAYGSGKHSRLYRNLGDLKFADINKEIGLPAIPALGVAVGDVNNDGWADLLLVAAEGGNRLYLNEEGKRVREAASVSKTLQSAWKYGSGDDTTCAAVLADVNRDGWLDIIMGHHFERPWLAPVPIRLYLNRGNKSGEPEFSDVTDKAGLLPLPMKAAHVEVQDFDNDGWPDIYVSIVKFADGKVHPLIFRNQGVSDGAVTFKEQMLAINDFPTAEDRAITRTGTFFDKMLRDGKITYTASAPTADFDRDGKIDLFLTSWWVETPALLLKNETPGGNWLTVGVRGSAEKKVNRDGIGAVVHVYAAGKLGKVDSLLGVREIAAGYGYSSGQEPLAHFGLGKHETVDVLVTWPQQRDDTVRLNVKANQRVVIE